MRRYIFWVSILAVILIASGCWFIFVDDLMNPNSNEAAKETAKQSECIVKLDINRDGNIFKDKNFGDKVKVIDKRFSELVILDATNPKDYADKGGEKVGKLISLSNVDYRDAAVYLVRNQILKTYVHLGSKVCLSDEKGDKLDTLYVAYFIGTHEFCTNECETAELNFRVMIEKDSGYIYLTK